MNNRHFINNPSHGLHKLACCVAKRTVAPRRAGAQGKGSIPAAHSQGGAMAHNVSSAYAVRDITHN